MPELNAEQTKGVLDALAWDWDVEPGIPSPEDAAGELLAYVADTSSRRTTPSSTLHLEAASASPG